MIAKRAVMAAAIAVNLLVSASALAAIDPDARPGVLAHLPDGRRLNFRCSGSGRPTVVLEGGFAATSLAWYRVAPVLATRYRVCAYDRAGYGFSDPGPMPRDGAAVANDLDLGLRALKVSGPLILVGHSAGGLYVRLLADRRQADVVGLVLVDPSVEFQDLRMADRFGSGAGSLGGQIDRAGRCLGAALAGALPSTDSALKICFPPPAGSPEAQAARLAEARRPATWETQVSELRTLWTSTSTEVAHGRQSYGALPIVVLTADGTYAGAPPAARVAPDDFWTAMHKEIAARSTRGRETRVTRSSHLMMLDRPDAIVAAVDEVARQAREKRPAAARRQ